MPKKCSICGILLDVPCANSVCTGHQNESIGNVCAYCVTNERDKILNLRDLSSLFLSSLADAIETKLPDVEVESEDS